MSERMSQSEIDALIAQMTAAESQTAAASAPPEAPAPADSAQTGSSTALSQAEIDTLFSTASEPEPVDRGMILQSEVDALVAAATARRESITAVPVPSPPPEPEPPALGLASLLMEISLVLTVELGRTRMPLKQVLGLSPGAVITLENHIATEPVRVLINETPVMKAEVVVIGENYGIRVTESRLTRKVS